MVEINATSIRLILLVLFFDLSQFSKLDKYDSQLEARYLKYALVVENVGFLILFHLKSVQGWKFFNSILNELLEEPPF